LPGAINATQSLLLHVQSFPWTWRIEGVRKHDVPGRITFMPR
jgi:hypothetical protein